MMRDGVPFVRVAELVLDHPIPNYQADIMERVQRAQDDSWWGTEGRRH